MTITVLLITMIMYWAIGIYYGGRIRPSYSHLTDTISELGEAGSSHAIQVGYGLFLPIGIVLFIIALVLNDKNEAAALLSTFLACGYFFSAFFPCDPGTPLLGSWKNSLHNIVGAVCYVGCAYALNEMTSDDFKGIFNHAVLMLLMVFLLVFMIGWPKIVGLLQKITELGLFVVMYLQS